MGKMPMPRKLCKIRVLNIPRINLSSTPEQVKTNNPWITGFLTPVCTVRCDSVIAPPPRALEPASSANGTIRWKPWRGWRKHSGRTREDGSDLSATTLVGCLKNFLHKRRMIWVCRCLYSRIAAPPATGRRGEMWIMGRAMWNSHRILAGVNMNRRCGGRWNISGPGTCFR